MYYLDNDNWQRAVGTGSKSEKQQERLGVTDTVYF